MRYGLFFVFEAKEPICKIVVHMNPNPNLVSIALDILGQLKTAHRPFRCPVPESCRVPSLRYGLCRQSGGVRARVEVYGIGV